MGRSSVVLESVKYVENLAGVLRACAAFDAGSVYWTGHRFSLDMGGRLRREFRMKDYQHVKVVATERPFDLLLPGIVPVCVELLPGSIPLDQFVHPENAVYVFGPEDGSVSQVFRRFCHHFVHIPSAFCLNLAATVNVVLYDRMAKLSLTG